MYESYEWSWLIVAREFELILPVAALVVDETLHSVSLRGFFRGNASLFRQRINLLVSARCGLIILKVYDFIPKSGSNMHGTV